MSASISFSLVSTAVLLQTVQLVGAALVLAAFALLTAKRLAADSVAFQLLNTCGAALLAVVAILGVQLGFAVLNVTWTGIGCYGLWHARSHPPCPETLRPSA